jgi:Protein of unknown function (DUF3443)
MFSLKFSKNVSLCSAALMVINLIGCSVTQNPPINRTCEPIVTTPIPPSGPNQAPLIVGCGYFNEPCVTVTICTPGSTLGSSTNCQTIPNVLLDTGSVGLRLFTCAVTIPLTNETDSLNNNIGDYVGYLDGSCDWGPVKTADVYIGSSEKAGSVPIQIIDATFASVPGEDATGNSCVQPDYSPLAVGFNGILGVGLSLTDCFLGDAASCATQGLTGTNNNGQSNGTYFSCTASGVCNNTTLAAQFQVTNPVSLMNHNNNGVILEFPSMSGSTPNTGNITMIGSLTVGIGTALLGDASNSLGSATIYKTDQNNDFQTNFAGFDGAIYPAAFGFIDSGSNTLAFPTGTTLASTLIVCDDTSETPGFYCPGGLVPLSATQAGYLNSPVSTTINFNVANASSLLASGNPNVVFNDIASSTGSSTYFDWGFPFFIGNKVFVHITGQTSGGQTAAPFWAW